SGDVEPGFVVQTTDEVVSRHLRETFRIGGQDRTIVTAAAHESYLGVLSGDIQAFDYRMQKTALTLDVEQPEVYKQAFRDAVQYHREENARHEQVRAEVRQALLEELFAPPAQEPPPPSDG